MSVLWDFYIFVLRQRQTRSERAKAWNGFSSSLFKNFFLFLKCFSLLNFSLLTLSPPNTECSRSLCSRCYTLGGAITHLLNQSRNSQTGSCRNSDLIWKHMHIKNNAIINTNRIWMKTVWCSRVKCGSRKDCEALGELMEDIYCSFALIILLNMIQM